MFSIGLLVHAQHLTGSFAAAGLVTAAYAVALGIGGPLLGRVVDRRGQTPVLLAARVWPALAARRDRGCCPSARALGVWSRWPPGSASRRRRSARACARCCSVMPRRAFARYAVEASAVELTWVFGPPLALGAGALFSTGAALAGAGASCSSAARWSSPRTRPRAPGARRRRRRAAAPCAAPAMRTLTLVMLAVGVVFGAVEIGVAASGEALGSSAAAGPLLGIWGAGSLLGGLLAARAVGGCTTSARCAGPRRRPPPRARRARPRARALRRRRASPALLVGLTAGHLALALAATNVYALAAVLFLAGAAIAPTYATVYALVERAAPAGTVTEAFAWLATAVAVGAARAPRSRGRWPSTPGRQPSSCSPARPRRARWSRPWRASLRSRRGRRTDRRGHDPLSRTAPRDPGGGDGSVPLRRARRDGVRGDLAAGRGHDRRRAAGPEAARRVRRPRPAGADRRRRAAARGAARDPRARVPRARRRARGGAAGVPARDRRGAARGGASSCTSTASCSRRAGAARPRPSWRGSAAPPAPPSRGSPRPPTRCARSTA